MAEISKETFKVIEVKKGERVKKAPLPFTTSTLQVKAFSHLRSLILRQVSSILPE